MPWELNLALTCLTDKQMTMLQKVDFEDGFQPLEADQSYLASTILLSEAHKAPLGLFLSSLRFDCFCGRRRRIAVAGNLSCRKARFLVQSQQIPTELVRPTVTSAAQERIQVIEQRTMTRDNLVAIADKFQLFPDKRTLMSVTELVALIRKQTKIKRRGPFIGLQAKVAEAKIPPSCFLSGSNIPIPRQLRVSRTN